MVLEPAVRRDPIGSFVDDLEEFLRTKPAKTGHRRVNARALLVFLALGVPAAVLLLASFLSYWGIYIDVLRPLWRPEPSDDVKWLLGGTALFVTVYDLLRSQS